MKRIWNDLTAILRQEEEEPPSMGLAANLEQFLEDNPELSKDVPEPGTVVDEEEEEIEEPPVRREEVTDEDEEESEEEDTEEEDEEPEDLGLPGLSTAADEEKEEEEAPAFDEKAFDAATEKVIKAMEDAGHPGEAYRESRNEIKKLQKQIQEGGASSAELEELRKANLTLQEKADQFDAMKERVDRVTQKNAQLMLEENPDYVAKVSEPYAQIEENVKALAASREIPANEVWNVLRENDPVKRNELLDELEDKIGARNALDVQAMSKSLRVIAQTDREMRDNAEQIVQQAKDAEISMSSQEIEQRNSAVRAAATQSFDQYASKIPGLTDDSGNLNEIGRKLKAKAAIHDVSKLSNSDMGYMIFSTETLPEALHRIRKLEAENRDLRVAAGKKGIPLGGKKTTKKKTSSSDERGGSRPAGLLSHMEGRQFTGGV